MRTDFFSQEIPSVLRSVTQTFLISQLAAAQRALLEDKGGRGNGEKTVLRQSWPEFCLKIYADFHIIIIFWQLSMTIMISFKCSATCSVVFCRDC